MKCSTKQAKEMYEHTLKLESEYRQYISGKDFNALVSLTVLKPFLTF